MKKVKPLFVVGNCEDIDDEIILYANKEALIKLKNLISLTLDGITDKSFDVFVGKKERHKVTINLSSHADFSSDYDE